MNNEIWEKRIGLIFSLDYEIHGNGRGDFNSWAYFPTSQMLDIFDTYKAKLTIMAEMGHYWAMKRYYHNFSNEINLFESQLKNAILRGHDVQLHIHPQWLEAEYLEGRWCLDFSRRTIERFCHNYEDAVIYLKKGKNDLENLLTPINPNYQCKCFRAGYLQMQPSNKIIKALEDSGFLLDSSVQKGTVAIDDLRILDYSRAYSRYKPWIVSPLEICNRDDSGNILEFPILTEQHILQKIISRLAKCITGTRVKGINKVIPGFLSNYSDLRLPNLRISLSNRIKVLISKSWDYVDFCRRDNKYLIKAVKSAISESRYTKTDNYVPLVLIGHSKDFFFANYLSLFLEACKEMEEIEFITFTEAVKKYSVFNS